MPRTGPVTVLSRAFVGRDEELMVLQGAWRQGSSAWVVSSSAGIGKSRLVRELGSWALTAGGLVLTGRCSPTGQNVPLRPFREALLAASRAGYRPGAGLEPFVPTLARVVPAWGDAAVDRSALVLGEGILRLVSSWAAPSVTTLLVIEDLQWADPESVAVLEYVVDNLAGAPLLVVATLRDGAPGPGADVAADLAARRAAHALRLEPLSDDEVVAMARSCLQGDELPGEAGAALVARCDGVPFLVEELLATAVRSGWGTITDDVPGSVAASVTTRLHDLPPSAQSLLTAAAVLGRHFDWKIAAAGAGVAEDAAIELLRLAVQAQLVDVEGAGFRFRHALTRDAVVAAALPAEHVAVASRALAVLTAADPDLAGEHCSLGAQLAAAAGQPDRAARLWLQAAERALEDGSVASADALAALACDAAVDDDLRLAAERVLLRVCVQAGQTARALALGEVLLTASADVENRTDVHLTLGAADLVAGRWDDADGHATAARALAVADPARLARGDALAAHAAMGRAEADVAVALARSALDGARVTGQLTVECEALEVIGRAERGRDLIAAEAAFTQAHDIATDAGLRLWRARAMQELGTIDMFHSLSPDRLLAARRLAVEAGASAMTALVDLQLGALYEERGDVAAALEAARRCEEASRLWRLSTLPMSLAVQAFAHAQVGERAAAVAAIEAALATGEDRPHIEARSAANVHAVLHIVAGDLTRAARRSDEAMASLRAHPGATHTFPGQWALLRTILDDGGEAARAEVAALAVDTPVSRAMLLAADAVAAGRSARRDDADAMFAQVDASLVGEYRRAFVRHLVAPAAHKDGWGEPIRWLLGSLATFETTGHGALAARCRILLRDAGAPVPRKGRGETGDVAPVLAALGITSREADVLALVAAGATNRAVGERLFISTRTVDKHVERLLQKAGTTRPGLADLARQAGLLRT